MADATNPSFQMSQPEISAVFALLASSAAALSTGNPLNHTQLVILHQMLSGLPVMVQITQSDQAIIRSMQSRLEAFFRLSNGFASSIVQNIRPAGFPSQQAAATGAVLTPTTNTPIQANKNE